MKSLDRWGSVVVNRWTFELTGRDLIQPKYPITGGKSLMKYIVNEYEIQLRQNVTDKGDTLLTDDDKKFYSVFRWDGDDLILDNSSTFLNPPGSQKRPEVLFGPKLVEVMNWIGTDRSGFYYTNGNLRTEADSVPDDVERDWTNVNQYRTWTELFGYTNEGLHLSSYCDWRFVYLDEAYHKAFGMSVSNKPRRPMYLYSNVGRSMIVGNQITDLLREVPYALENRHFEPSQIQYLPVRSDVLDIIEVQVAEIDGKLVEFSPGVTSVTLHFKHE